MLLVQKWNLPRKWGASFVRWLGTDLSIIKSSFVGTTFINLERATNIVVYWSTFTLFKSNCFYLLLRLRRGSTMESDDKTFPEETTTAAGKIVTWHHSKSQNYRWWLHLGLDPNFTHVSSENGACAACFFDFPPKTGKAETITKKSTYVGTD